MITAKVIADSYSYMHRLTTLQLTYPRMILAEFNTHRVFSRSTSSSRAIPTSKMIEQVRTNPAKPIHWGQNQSGMQANGETEYKATAELYWKQGAIYACEIAEEMNNLGLHKQVVNRVLEPYMLVSTVVTSTEWANFFGLRLHPDAQPEIQELARAMKHALESSKPQVVAFHLPYITEKDRVQVEAMFKNHGDIQRTLAEISSARCARVSYRKHDGSLPSIEDDLKLFKRLSTNEPMHASPMEHQAMSANDDNFHKNFRGWIQFREHLEAGSWNL